MSSDYLRRKALGVRRHLQGLFGLEELNGRILGVYDVRDPDGLPMRQSMNSMPCSNQRVPEGTPASSCAGTRRLACSDTTYSS